MSEWAKAFVAAQAEMPEITKTKTADTGKYKYSYADLSEIVAKVRPVLSKHGLAVAQDVETLEGSLHVSTLVFHVSGEKEAFGPIVFPEGNSAQAAGSAITYARRYSLCAALNIAADEDDDGQASKVSAGSASQPRGSRPASPPKNAGGGADGADNPPNKAAAGPASPPTNPQAQEDVSHNKEQSAGAPRGGDSVPPGSESWTTVLETYGAAGVLQIAQEVAKELGLKAPFTKRALVEMPAEVFEKVTERIGEKERVA